MRKRNEERERVEREREREMKRDVYNYAEKSKDIVDSDKFSSPSL
jgi:hypothetical protein